MDKDNKTNSRSDNKRVIKEDRRNLNRSVSFPYQSREGLVVLKDRRKQPDRRVNNITVDNAEIDEEEFIKKYQKFI